jgi:hypothetical protein
VWIFDQLGSHYLIVTKADVEPAEVSVGDERLEVEELERMLLLEDRRDYL